MSKHFDDPIRDVPFSVDKREQQAVHGSGKFVHPRKCYIASDHCEDNCRVCRDDGSQAFPEPKPLDPWPICIKEHAQEPGRYEISLLKRPRPCAVKEKGGNPAQDQHPYRDIDADAVRPASAGSLPTRFIVHSAPPVFEQPLLSPSFKLVSDSSVAS